MGIRKTDEQFRKELYEINPNIIPLEEYKSANTKIKCICNKCNHIWYPTPDRIVRRKIGCPKCNKGILKTNYEFLKELYEVNPNIEPLEEYKGTDTKIKFRCKICNNIWETTPYCVLKNKSGCPNLCTKPKASSVPEQNLMAEIQSLIKNKLTSGRYFSSNNEKYQLDGYFESLGIGIEYDGLYWHSNDKYKQYNKKIFFKDLDIDVIFVREDE